MSKVIKWGAIVIGGLIVLIVVAILLVPYLVNIERYRDDIAKAASDKLGRPVAIAGDMKLSLLPSPAVILRDMRIDNPPEFKGAPLASVAEAALKISLWPLFDKKLVVENFILKNPTVSLVKNADGKGNWEGLGSAAPGAASPQPSTQPEKPTPVGKPSEGPSSLKVVIEQASIENGEMTYSDPAQNTQTTISSIEFKIDNVSLDQSIGLEFSAIVDHMPITLKGAAGPLDRTGASPRFPVDFQLTALDSAKVSLKGVILDPMGKPGFDFALEIPSFSLRDTLSKTKWSDILKDMDPNALRDFSLKAGIKGSPDRLTVDRGAIKLDQSDIDVSADIDLQKRSADSKLTISKFNLDPYLPKSKAKQSEAKQVEPTSKPAPAPAPPAKKEPAAATGKPWSAKSDVKIGEFQTGNIAINDIQAKIDLKNNVLDVAPFSFGIFQGRTEGSLELDARQAEPRYKLKTKIKDVQLLPLLKAVAGRQDMSGVMVLDADLSASGSSADGIVRTLAGQGQMVMTNVYYRGQIEPTLEKVIAAVAPNSQAAAEYRRVDKITYPFTSKEGVLNTRDGQVYGPRLSAGIAGNINLAAQTLYLTVNARLFNKISLPIIVSGPLASPSVKGDFSRIPLSELKNLPKDLQNLVPSGLKASEEIPGQIEKKAEDFLKKLPFGKQRFRYSPRTM